MIIKMMITIMIILSILIVVLFITSELSRGQENKLDSRVGSFDVCCKPTTPRPILQFPITTCVMNYWIPFGDHPLKLERYREY